MVKQTNKSVSIIEPTNRALAFNDAELDLLIEASATTGVQTKGEAIMVFKKAQELGIGPANAIPHIHIVNGKAGIDIHIIKAILARPSSFVKWIIIDDYRPMYAYTNGKQIYTDEEVHDNEHFEDVKFLKDNPRIDELKAKGITAVVKVPTKDKNGSKQYIPTDYISSYKFTRTKRNAAGKLEDVVVVSSFKWSEALTAQLPFNRDGIISKSSNWYKYRKLMLGVRAFTFGARDIASDLLLGNYESSELYEFENINYDITPDGTTTIID